jgi:chromosome segregation ATPase
MANDNKNNKLLVTDDEPTTELSTLSTETAKDGAESLCTKPVDGFAEPSPCNLSTRSRQGKPSAVQPPVDTLEKALITDNVGAFDPADNPNTDRITCRAEQSLLHDLQTELACRAKIIDRLSYDNEQHLGKQKGLEAELRAHQEIVAQLHRDCRTREDELLERRKVLAGHELLIKQLKNELHHVTRANGRLLEKAGLHERECRLPPNDLVDLSGHARNSKSQSGVIGHQAAEIAELRAQLQRTEEYAAKLRTVLLSRDDPASELAGNRRQLRTSLAISAEKVGALEAELEKEHKTCASLNERLANLRSARALEMRAMRSELDEIQQALSEAELATQELASDLVESHGYRDQLEIMLQRTEEQSRAHIDRLERENQRLDFELTNCLEKLDGRGRAINDLLAELAKKSRLDDAEKKNKEAAAELEQRAPERSTPQRTNEKDRFTRLLVGTIDGQEVRFPLFNNRLTIGRSAQNDIQLEAAFVSRRHAVLVTDQDTARIVDWGSRNGVYVNSNRITEHFLDNNDVITIGIVNFRYEERPKRET